MFGETKVVHNFQDSLAASHAASDLPIWEEIYRAAFRDFACMVDHRQDGEHQRAGIDRSVILENSKQILIDEKIRYKAYNDIFLEYWSDLERKIPGWAFKSLRADYICYAIAPTGRAWLFPVQQLQKAIQAHKHEWKTEHSWRLVPNRGYTTAGIIVDPDTLISAISEAFSVKFTPQPHSST